MATPIDIMMEGVDWQKTDNDATVAGLYATHSGVLEIGGFKLRCYRLNDGMAVFDADDVEKFFNGILE